MMIEPAGDCNHSPEAVEFKKNHLILKPVIKKKLEGFCVCGLTLRETPLFLFKNYQCSLFNWPGSEI